MQEADQDGEALQLMTADSGTEETMWGGLTASKSQSQDLTPGKPTGVTDPWEDPDPALKAPGIQVLCPGPCLIPD